MSFLGFEIGLKFINEILEFSLIVNNPQDADFPNIFKNRICHIYFEERENS
jgi:hypothetical protein